jgi:hypothetical protein
MSIFQLVICDLCWCPKIVNLIAIVILPYGQSLINDEYMWDFNSSTFWHFDLQVLYFSHYCLLPYWLLFIEKYSTTSTNLLELLVLRLWLLLTTQTSHYNLCHSVTNLSHNNHHPHHHHQSSHLSHMEVLEDHLCMILKVVKAVKNSSSIS